MALPAARRSDFHICPADTGGVPHTGGPVLAVGSVETNSLDQAHAGDRAVCVGPLDFIVTGSGTVTIHSKPAARSTDKTMHGGVILAGSGNVLIGGPTVGIVLGNQDAAQKACAAAAAGRPGGNTQQSTDNCGMESSRIWFEQATGQRISEADWLAEAQRKGLAAANGNCNGTQRAQMLADHGVDSTRAAADGLDDITQGVADGKGVMTWNNAQTLWDSPGTDARLAHVVNVTGIKYGPDGKPESVIVLDTGTGECAAEIPIDRFKKSLGPTPWPVMFTKTPIW